jgi:exopolyphosphatase/guanosine-5'-triphosphate,3'-diphosphate pyrophosphatase
VRNCLADYRRTLESLGAERALAVATSAIRDAENGEAFLGEVEWSYGFSTRLLSGDEEALLTFRGVSSTRPLPPGTLIVDLGGGSTELIVAGTRDVAFRTSLVIGAVRLTERFLHADPPALTQLEECSGAVRALFAERIPDAVRAGVRDVIGVAGTVTSLAALDLGLGAYDRDAVHGHHLSREGVERQLERLAALPLAERRTIPALEPDRAPVIVAGAIIVRQVLGYFEIDAVEASEHDLLDGAALAAAELPEPVEGDAPPGAYTCC